MSDEVELDNTIEFMRLMLVAQLAKITGIIWVIETDRSVWDVLFQCRYGPESHDRRDIDLGAEEWNSAIKNGMEQVATKIAISYWKYMLLHHDVGEKEK
jgi:hypothetical protein